MKYPIFTGVSLINEFLKKLENNRVLLKLLTAHNSLYLSEIATEPCLIRFSPSNISTPKALKTYTEEALILFESGTTIPFCIYDKKFNKYAGSTRFGNIDYHNRVLHIGWTWIGKEFQGTGLNKNMKYLMLKHAFEIMEFEKVEFRIDERNEKSRYSVESIGAKLEGTLRNNVLMNDGYRRNTCCYGIIKAEWPNIERILFNKL